MEKLLSQIDNTELVDKIYSKFYLTVKTKFFINIILSTILTLIAIELSKPWEQPSIFYKFSTGIDLIIPYIDFSSSVNTYKFWNIVL